MENMDSKLSPFQPEEAEQTEAAIKEKVSTWIEAYSAERASREPAAYIMPGEVEEWFTAYKTHGDELDANKYEMEKEDWIQKRDQMEAEYEEKIKIPEYELFHLIQKEDALHPDDKGRYEYQIEKLQRRLLEAQREQWWTDNADNIPARNMRTHFEQTATAMADIEGLGWANNQLKEHESLSGALRYFEKHKEHERLSPYQIYGNGGINRWFVKGDGTVTFSEGHALEDTVEKVKRRGFIIH